MTRSEQRDRARITRIHQRGIAQLEVSFIDTKHGDNRLPLRYSRGLMSNEPRQNIPPADSVPPSAQLAIPTQPTEPPPASQLTPEEQMAQFEKELKETDWGHQPC